MKRPAILPILGCLIFASAACTSTQGKGAPCAPPKNSVQVPFQSVLEDSASSSSGADPQRFEVIRTQQRLDEVWQELFMPNAPPSPPPSIDFDLRMVLLYAAGTKPDGCHSAAITEVRRIGQRLHVDAVETIPGPSCVCTFAIVMPFHLVEIDRFAGPASLCVRTATLQCPSKG